MPPKKKRSAAKKAAPKRAAKKAGAKKAVKKAPAKKAASKKTAKKRVSAESVPAKKAVRKRVQRKTPKPKKRNRLSVANIKRIDSEKTHGWQVHVCRAGILRTKLFSDRVHGGKLKALELAKVCREQLRAEMG